MLRRTGSVVSVASETTKPSVVLASHPLPWRSGLLWMGPHPLSHRIVNLKPFTTTSYTAIAFLFHRRVKQSPPKLVTAYFVSGYLLDR
jgi:hypothetical protein